MTSWSTCLYIAIYIVTWQPPLLHTQGGKGMVPMQLPLKSKLESRHEQESKFYNQGGGEGIFVMN